ncbi:MAG: nitrophenyl compound nitroreductase subunit ArsF family protein [Candidatus Omnitrophota bacterium]
MAKRIITVLLMFMVFSLPAAGTAAEENALDKSTRVIAYYFHGNFRCPTCRNLEQYAKEVIENNFRKDLSEGTLVFKAVNVEKSENEHFIDDYKLYSKSLVLSLVKDGKEIKYKNLTKIWQLVRDKGKYINYVKDEITAFIKEK